MQRDANFYHRFATSAKVAKNPIFGGFFHFFLKMAGWDSLIFAPDVVQTNPEHPACSNWTDHFGKTYPGKSFGVRVGYLRQRSLPSPRLLSVASLACASFSEKLFSGGLQQLTPTKRK